MVDLFYKYVTEIGLHVSRAIFHNAYSSMNNRNTWCIRHIG